MLTKVDQRCCQIENAGAEAKASGLLKHWQLVLYGTEESPLPTSEKPQHTSSPTPPKEGDHSTDIFHYFDQESQGSHPNQSPLSLTTDWDPDHHQKEEPAIPSVLGAALVPVLTSAVSVATSHRCSLFSHDDVQRSKSFSGSDNVQRLHSFLPQNGVCVKICPVGSYGSLPRSG